MGTRADFYTGRGLKAEWVGSIAWDGCPDCLTKAMLRAKDKRTFRKALKEFFAGRDDVTLPEQGWPWPWEDSRTSDYAYAYDEGKVWVSGFGREYITVRKYFRLMRSDDGAEAYFEGKKEEVFPNMKERQNVTLGPRSGVLILGL
jgi:hypothetical protein